jgi:peptidoglycan hydrolase-like protein with peptidoglycan-binding domain
LPASLEPNTRRLVIELRRLKDHSGLTLASLQAKTHFSGSAWERYLNGRALPPASAVEALAAVTGAGTASLLALRDAAEQARDNVAPERRETPPRRAPEVNVAALSVVAGALLLSATASVLLVAGPWATPAPSAAQAGASGAGKYTCSYTRRGDLLFAGNSATTSHLVMRNTTGPDAAEVQCLLLRHRLSPGEVDGYYGAHTEAEVRELQRRDHVPVDGVVGEQTWALLRGVR